MSEKRILLVDDHQLIIDGLRGFIENEPGLCVVGEANTGMEAIRLADILEPHLILMDIEMPELSGIQACQEIKRNHSDIKVIIVSMHNEKQLIKRLIDQGADGYLLKNSRKDEVLEAISRVLTNEVYLSEDASHSLHDKPLNGHHKNGDLLTMTQLTEREIEILKLVAEGLTNKEIGDQLVISHRTVDTHRTNLMKKLDVSNVAGLIRFAFKNGLIK